MGIIKQVIGLEDRVSPTLSKIQQQAMANVRAYEQLQSQLRALAKATDDMEAAGNTNNKVFQDTVTAIDNVTKEMAEYEDGTRNAKIATEDMGNSMRQLTGVAMRLVGAYLSFRGLKQLIGLSDTFTQSTARLNLMNDGLQTTAELQDKIYYSAQRSRVAYQSMVDTVAKLGMQAKDAFSSNDEIIAFTEGLNKLFTVSGMDSSSISSVMYNLTQSMSTGHLLGNDYRILKMNAPKIVQLLKETYADGSQEALDKMVSNGQISGKMLKNAILGNLKEIEEEFNQMPVTFEQAWTKFSNTLQRMLVPVFNVLTQVAEALDSLFTFLSQNQYILITIGAAILAIVAPLIAYNVATGVATFVTTLFSKSLAGLYLKFALIIAGIALLVGGLIYLWNTNDDVANAMLVAWDALQIGIKIVIVAIKGILLGFLSFFEFWAKVIMAPLNAILWGMQQLGFDVAPIEIDFTSKLADSVKSDLADIGATASALNASRADRVANRTKIGVNQLNPDLEKSLNNFNSIIDPSEGAMRTTSNDSLLKDEDIQLLLDIATRDYKLNYQQITPEVIMNLNVDQTMDIDYVMEEFSNRMQEAIEQDMEVVPA